MLLSGKTGISWPTRAAGAVCPDNEDTVSGGKGSGMASEITRVLLLLLLAGVLFSAGLGGYDLWPPDEPRFAEVAREMMQSGDYLVPRVNGEPYKEKPPLLFWLIALASQPAGEVTAVTARIPSVLAGILTVLFTYLLGRRLFGPRVAFWSALVLMTAQRVWWQAHFGQIDMLLAACLTGALLAFASWRDSGRWHYLVLFYVASAAALYAKGPGVLVFPGLLVLTLAWREDEPGHVVHLALGMAAVCLLYAVWLVPARAAASAELGASAGTAMAANLFRQTVGRFALGVSHANPPWYYLKTLPLDWLPWALFLPWTLLWVWRHRDEGLETRLLLCWIVPAFLFFSIAIGKRAIYLLPLFPAMSIFIARSILDLVDDPSHTTWRRRTAWVWGLILLLLAAAPLALLATEYREMAYDVRVLVFSLVAGLFGLWALGGKIASRLPTVMAIQFAVLALTAASVVFPMVNPHKSAKAFCEPVRHLARQGAEFDLYSVGFAREEYVFYSERFLDEQFTDLLDMSEAGDQSLAKQARLQKDLRRAMAKGVEEVPIADIGGITPAEIGLLRQGMCDALDEKGFPRGIQIAFQDALSIVGRSFFRSFQGGRPAFAYVQEEDWRWVCALLPETRKTTVVRQDNVGRRTVLLVANRAGARLVSNGPVE